MLALRTVLVSCVCAGCTVTPPPRLVDQAILASVSADQRWVAYYTNTSQTTGVIAGALSVAPLPSGPPIALAASAFSSFFDRGGDTLTFSTGLQYANDTGPKQMYGAVNVWRPALTQPVLIDAGLSVLDVAPPDRAWVLTYDAPLPERGQTGNLVLVRTAECTGTTCQPITVATGVEVLALFASNDGRYAAYETHVVGPLAERFEAWLLTIADGKVVRLSSSLVANPIALSPDGALCAATQQVGPSALQLQVFSTATGLKVPWSAQPAMTTALQLAFSDAQTLIVRYRVMQGGLSTVWRTTATAATPLGPGRAFQLQRIPDGAARFLFVSPGQAVQPAQELSLYDLQNPAPQAVSIGSATSGLVVADDLSRARFLEGFDPNLGAGALTVAELPSGKLTTLAQNVSSGLPAFFMGSSRVLRMDAPGGNGTLFEWNGSTTRTIAQSCFGYRTRVAPEQLYLSLTAPDAVTGAPSPGIYRIGGDGLP